MTWAFSRALSGVALIATTVLPATLPADAQTQQQLDWCSGKARATPDLQSDGCTAVIESGKYSGAFLAAIFLSRGNAYDDKGDYDRAIADYNEAIRLDPKNSAAFFNRGLTSAKKKDYDGAIANYSAAIQLNRKDPDAFYKRGIAYDDKGDYVRAIADYNEAIRLDPNHTQAIVKRAAAIAKRNQ